MRTLITVLLSIVAIESNAQVQVLGVIKTIDNFNNAVIVCDGNSLTYGYRASDQATTSYPARIQQAAPFATDGTTVYNKGVNGQTTQQMIDDADTDIDPLYNGSVKSILVAWECGNDLYYNGDATAAYTRFVTYCQDRRAAGWKVIAVTLPYRDHSLDDGVTPGVSPAGDDDAAYNTKRLTINSNIVANWETFADGLANIATNPGLSSYNTTYYYDRIHFNDDGYQLVADLILPVILTL
jgi:lysophospholipase L1-like esterase